MSEEDLKRVRQLQQLRLHGVSCWVCFLYALVLLTIMKNRRITVADDACLAIQDTIDQKAPLRSAVCRSTMVKDMEALISQYFGEVGISRHPSRCDQRCLLYKNGQLGY